MESGWVNIEENAWNTHIYIYKRVEGNLKYTSISKTTKPCNLNETTKSCSNQFTTLKESSQVWTESRAKLKESSQVCTESCNSWPTLKILSPDSHMRSKNKFYLHNRLSRNHPVTLLTYLGNQCQHFPRQSNSQPLIDSLRQKYINQPFF